MNHLYFKALCINSPYTGISAESSGRDISEVPQHTAMSVVIFLLPGDFWIPDPLDDIIM